MKRAYEFNGLEINGLTIEVNGQYLVCSDNGHIVTYGGAVVESPKQFLLNLEDSERASLETVINTDPSAALSYSSWAAADRISKEEFRAKKAILTKAQAVRNVLVESIIDFTTATGEDHITKSYKALAQAIAGKDRETGKQRPVNRMNEYIQYLAGFISLEQELQSSMLASILHAMYQHQCNPVAKGGILESSLESQVSKPIGEIVGKYILTSFKLKKEIKRTSMAIDVIDVYAERGIEMAHVLIEVLTYFKLLWVFVPDNKVSYEVFARVDFLKLDENEDKYIIKYLSKDYSGTDLKPHRMLFSEQSRLPMYSGKAAKKNPLEQPKHVVSVLDSVRSHGYMFGERLANPEHPLGKQMLALYTDGLEHDSQFTQFAEYRAANMGKVLFQEAKLTKDNGRMNTTHNTTAGKAKLYESEYKELLTPEAAQLFYDAIVKLEAKPNPKRKEQMELLHYKDAVWCYENNIPSGHYLSKDFTGSGPLMQSIATGDWERFLFSVSYNGSKVHDPYMEILNAVYTIHSKEIMTERVRNLYGNFTDEEVRLELRQWIKSLMQPTMYGAGEATALKKAYEDNKFFDLEYDVFLEAFEKAMPGTARLLKYLKDFTKAIIKQISKDPRNPAYRTLQYATPFGTNCRITSFKQIKDEDGNTIPYKYTFALGRRKDVGVPVSILDPEALGASLVAAFSHQFDESVMMMMHMLVKQYKLEEGIIENQDSMQSTHDDFLDHGNYAHFIDKAAQEALKFHWDIEDSIALFCDQVSKPLGFTFRKFIPVGDKRMLDIDWSSIQAF